MASDGPPDAIGETAPPVIDWADKWRDRMRFSLDVSQHQLEWPEILERAQFAESSGFEGVWLFDHFQPLYGSPDGPCLEGWTLLAALAAATERIRLGLLVTGVTYRHPSLLAAEAVTVDHVSSGRAIIGIGAAWYEKEHRELGFDFPSTRERIERLEEAIEVMRALMTGERVGFDGKWYSLDQAQYRPLPIQRPHPPILIGASGEKLMLPLVGRQADEWHAFGTPSEVTAKWSIVEAAAGKAGRDPSSIAISSSLSISRSWDAVRHDIDQFSRAGVSSLIVSWPSEGRDHLTDFVSNVMPDYSDQ